MLLKYLLPFRSRPCSYAFLHKQSNFWNKMCSLDRGTSHWRQNLQVPIARKAHWCQTPALTPDTIAECSWLPPEPPWQLIPKLASGKLLIIAAGEKKTGLDDHTTAEYSSFGAFCLLVACFPSSFVLNLWYSWSGCISKLLVWYFFLCLLSLEALLFPLTQMLLCPEECTEFFL